MNKIILIFLRSKLASQLFLKPALILHTWLYDLISILVMARHNNIHPKHDIIKYEQWFHDAISSDDIVLDIGCNEGELTRFLGKKARLAYGIEIVEKHIKRAHSLTTNPKVKFFLGDATAFNYFQLEPVSVIVMSNVLEHIKNRADFLKKILSLVKWKDQPRILIRIPTIERDWLPVYKKSLGLKYVLDNTHDIEHTMMEFLHEMKEANLEVVSTSVKFGEIYAECKMDR